MGTGTISYLILYSFLFAGIVTAWKTRFYQTALSLLVFSSIFVVFLHYTDDLFGTLVYGSPLAFLPAYLFYMQYERSPRKSSEDERSVGDVILGYLLVPFLVFLFKRAGAGWSLSLLMGYWVLYLLIIISYRDSRRVFYYAKIPFVLLFLGALVEEFGFQRELIPFVMVYLVLFVLWLKFDLPELTKEPRLT
ncbi:conserved membrane protein of unknown function [Thermococcus nautili]|uniref:hypothetical protein n=1 Tax=Thermococcus nautili TaxID=195522 RepID=UPI0025569FC8|nr:hypothetical protein [Thermococcus nautili]CAI1492703.1 conserved membrane protein of unknown function [Thermococcus nautili]